MKRLPLYLVLSGIAFAIVTRIILPWAQTFTPAGVVLNTPDAYMMLRYADTFPSPMAWDYFAYFPVGTQGFQNVTWSMFAAIFARVFNIGNDTALAVLPPAMFFLTAWFTWVIADRIFDRLTAAGAVFILCLLPGEILNRTMLGAGDYHCWEIMLVSCIIMLAVLFIQADSPVRKILLAVAVALVSAVYWTSWDGAPVILLIFTGTLYVCIALWLNNIVKDRLLLALLVCGALALPVLADFPFAGKALAVLTPQISEGTTEAMPLFFTDGKLDLGIIMGYFGVTFYIMLLGLGWLLYRIVKRQKPEDVLLYIWSAVMLILTLCRRRFDYYFAVNVAVLTSLVLVPVIQRLGRKYIGYAALVLFLALCLPLAKQSISLAASDFGRVPAAWQETCQWLKAQDSNQVSYATGSRPQYGVFSWWDYGYWLLGIGHQAVYTHNGLQDSNGASSILLSTDIDGTLAFLRFNQYRYLVIDQDMFRAYGLRSAQPEHSFMYQVYVGLVPGALLVHQSGSVKVFDVTIAGSRQP